MQTFSKTNLFCVVDMFWNLEIYVITYDRNLGNSTDDYYYTRLRIFGWGFDEDYILRYHLVHTNKIQSADIFFSVEYIY